MKKGALKREAILCILSCILASITELITIMSSLLMGDAIDLSLNGQLDRLLGTCLFLLAATVISNVIFVGSVYLNELYAHKSVTNLRDCLISSFFRRELHSFRKKNDAYYANLLGMDTENLCESYYMNCAAEIQFLVLFIGSIVAMARISYIMFFVSAAFSAIPHLITWLLEKRIQKLVEKTSAANEACQFTFLQLIQGYETLKLSGLDLAGLKKRTHDTIWNKSLAQVRQETVQSVSYNALDMVNTFGQLVLLAIGGWLIVSGRITAGQLVSCTVLTTYVGSGVYSYLRLHLARKAAKPLMDKVRSELSAAPEREKPALDTTRNDIVYDHVSFRFDSEKDYLLRDISFAFQKGGYYGIVGESGKGKTTLIKLLLRYYPDYEGSITLFGQDVSAYPESQLYQMVGILNQNEYILNANLFENITLFSGQISETDPEYVSLLERLNLSGLAKRTGSRPLGDFGDSISGGERQRVALARVLLKKPRLLILDEPTTGLDPENRDAINDIIKGLEGLTRIVITHDRSPEYLSQFDRILHLEEGGTIRSEGL